MYPKWLSATSYVHLVELEFFLVQVFVQAIVVKLQHVQLHELVNGDAALMIGLSDVHRLFALSDFEHAMNFLQVLKERRPEELID